MGSPAHRSVYAVTAATCSVVVGRISFALGLLGPSVSVDTACSAGLVACHSGRRTLEHQECSSALTAGMTSSSGRSYTFDVRADGYARGEACCVAVLQHALLND
eukprot:4574456-Prymnesium_polylepis.1